jgi:crotonobetainyl-CoA:carnitine CoA-transferase CaiB-like acyl-CoA transferase
MEWEELFAHEGFKALDMIQEVTTKNGYRYRTTRCPITIDGTPYFSDTAAPSLGADTGKIRAELLNN